MVYLSGKGLSFEMISIVMKGPRISMSHSVLGYSTPEILSHQEAFSTMLLWNFLKEKVSKILFFETFRGKNLF